MAWSWSHTHEAYRNAERNLYNLSPAEVAVIWAEWKAAVPTEYGEPDFDEAKYEEAHAKALALIRDGFEGGLYDDVWRWAEEHATCDNGGFNAWLCPWGCGPHCVPFDREHD
jgi:predicted nucleic acid-binding protein